MGSLAAVGVRVAKLARAAWAEIRLRTGTVRRLHGAHRRPSRALSRDHRPTLPPLGAGEASTVPVAAALANAIFDATGVRLRTVPFTAQRVKTARS